MKNNMLTGSPMRSMILFAIPLIIGNIFQQLYILTDSIIVGNAVGTVALAAVGATSTICNVFIHIATGLGMGCMVIISQLFGAHNHVRLKTSIYTSLTTMALLAALAVVIGLVFCDGILHLTNFSDDLFADARTYFIIYILGFPGLFIYNISNSAFNALGKSRMTLFFLIFSSVLNVLLDLWFVLGFHWGVAGAAVATIISQYLAAMLSFFMLLRYVKKNFPTVEKSRVFDPHMLGGIAKVALPSMLHMSSVSLGYLALQALVNTFSTEIVAGYVAAIKLDNLCIIPMTQVGNAAATFVGQNVGAKQFDRAVKGYHSALVINAVIAISITILMVICGRSFVGLFMDSSTSSAAIEAGTQYVIITCIFYIVMGSMNVTVSALRGAGDVMMSFVAILCNFTVRVAFAYIMVGLFHSELFIWWSNVIGWVTGLTVSYIRYRSGKWRTKRLVDDVS